MSSYWLLPLTQLLQEEEPTSLPPTENSITVEPPTISADDLPDIITEKVVQQILTEAYGPVATATAQTPTVVPMTTDKEDDEVATEFPYGVTEADGDFRDPVSCIKLQPYDLY